MVTEGAPSEETRMTAPEMVEESAGEAAGAVESMADEAAAVAEEAATATAEAVDEASSAAGQLVASAEQMAQTGGSRGKEVYDMACFACHAQGIAGAPKIGDKALWEARIAKGMDTLFNNAINGFQGSAGVMPPKGGRMDLSDEDVKAAVTYMVDQVK